MMNLGRIFAHAIVRRLAYVLVAVCLAWVGLSDARAQSGACEGSPVTCDKGQAYAAAVALADRRGSELCLLIGGPTGRYTGANVTLSGSDMWVAGVKCTPGGNSGNAGATYFMACAAPSVWNNTAKVCGVSCTAKPSYSTLFSPPGGSIGCSFDGCTQSYTAMGLDSEGRSHSRVDFSGAQCNPGLQKTNCRALNPGGSAPPLWVWNSSLGVCQPVQVQCQEGSSWKDGACTLDDGCPVGMVLNAQNICVKGPNDCPAGEIKGPDGACLNSDDGNKCPTGQAKAKDGTCKKDTDGDGKPDEEEAGNNEDGGKFSGGDNCNVPPTCSGDNIMCGQARIQWRIDCNTRRTSAIAGGACNTMPTCVGEKCKPIEHAQLIMQWRTACELEKLNSKSPGTENPGDGTAAPGTPDYDIQALTEDAAGEDGDNGVEGGGPDGVFTDESKNNDGAGGAPGGSQGGSAGELDDEGFGYSRSCPTIPDVNVFGTNVHFNIQPICDWVSLGGMIVLVLTSLLCLRIMSSSTQV